MDKDNFLEPTGLGMHCTSGVHIFSSLPRVQWDQLCNLEEAMSPAVRAECPPILSGGQGVENGLQRISQPSMLI